MDNVYNSTERKTPAIGIARRKGLGKIRHLDVTDLWIADKSCSKQIRLLKILGANHVADMIMAAAKPLRRP